MKRACEWSLKLFVVLLLVRLATPAPDVRDPPDMHAFYAAWLQPPWWLIVAPLAFALLLPWVVSVPAFVDAWRNRRK